MPLTTTMALGTIYGTNWQALAMEHGDTLLIVIGDVAAVVGTAVAATRDLSLKRRLDGTDRFVTIAANAQARGRDHGMGTSEQAAAIWLLAEFGITERHLRRPARAALKEIIDHIGESPSSAEHVACVGGEAAAALNALEGGQKVRWRRGRWASQ